MTSDVILKNSEIYHIQYKIIISVNNIPIDDVSR